MPTHPTAKTALAALTGAMLLPLSSSAETFFFSFDTEADALGAYTPLVTAEDFPGVPTFSKTGVGHSSEAGGAASFTDFQGNTWLGSGDQNPPGHSATFNPGSAGNTFTLTFETTGLSDLQLRLDVRSAGTNAHEAFSDILFDIGTGFTSAGFSLAERSFNADGFVEFTLNLSSLTAIENQSSVSLRFDIPNMTSNPNQSFRVDNIQMSAVPEPSSAVMLIGGMATLGLLRRRRW